MEQTLTKVQRRVLSNLSIPRNPFEISHCLQSLTYLGDAPRQPDDVDNMLRNGFTDSKLVAKLGRFDDTTKLFNYVQNSNGKLNLIPMADEQAQILERRLRAPHREWRMHGDLWMITQAGLEKLKEPVGDPTPHTPSQIQATVDHEWSRVIREQFVPGETSLGNALLFYEFNHWFKLASDECERLWGVRPRPPIAGGVSGYSDAYEVALLNAENQKTALGAVVDPWYMALSIMDFTDADTGTTADDGSHKPTYTTYARKSVAGTDMNAASGSSGSVTNSALIEFTGYVSGTDTIHACANTSALTGGTLRKWGDLNADVTIDSTHNPARFAANQYTTTVA